MRFMIAGMPLGSALSTAALGAAISSGAFMVFSQEAERLVPGPELEAMLALRRDFETYRSHSRWQQQRLPEFEMQWNLRQQITLSTIEIALFAAVADLIRNIMRRSLSLLDLAANDGQRFEPADLIFSAPFGEAVFHDAQAVLTSQEDVERWRIDNALRRRLTD